MKTTMTNELPDEIMENGIHYTLVGDYYFSHLYAGGQVAQWQVGIPV